MLLVDRYILREIVPGFFSNLVIFSSLLIVSQLIRLSGLLAGFGLDFDTLVLPLIYIWVPFLPLLIPLACFFAVVLGYGRLSADGELTALAAAGVSLYRLVRPGLLLALVAFGLAFEAGQHLEGWGRRAFVQFLYRKSQTQLDGFLRMKLREGVFVDDFLEYVLYAEKIAPNRVDYQGVILAPRGKDDGGAGFLLTAPRAQVRGSVVEGNLRMDLHEGHAYAFDVVTKRASNLSFQRLSIDLVRAFHERILGHDRAGEDYRSFTKKNLFAYVAKGQAAAKAGTLDERDLNELRKAEFLALSRGGAPLMVWAMTIIGFLMAMAPPRFGKGRLYMEASLWVVGMHLYQAPFRWAAEKGHIPAWQAVWLPPVVAGLCASLWLVRRSRRAMTV